MINQQAIQCLQCPLLAKAIDEKQAFAARLAEAERWIGIARRDYPSMSEWVDSQARSEKSGHQYDGTKVMSESRCVRCGYNPWTEAHRDCTAHSANEAQK